MNNYPDSPPSIHRSFPFDCESLHSNEAQCHHGYRTPTPSLTAIPCRSPKFIFRSISIEIQDADEDSDSSLLMPMEEDLDDDREVFLKPRFQSMALENTFLGDLYLPSLEEDGVSTIYENSFDEEISWNEEQRDAADDSTMYTENHRIQPLFLSPKVDASSEQASKLPQGALKVAPPPLPMRFRRRSFGAYAA